MCNLVAHFYCAFLLIGTNLVITMKNTHAHTTIATCLFIEASQTCLLLDVFDMHSGSFAPKRV